MENNFTELKVMLENKFPAETQQAKQNLHRAMKAMNFHEPKELLQNVIYWALLAETTCNIILKTLDIFDGEVKKTNENQH